MLKNEKKNLDLIQIYNLVDWLPIIKAGRIKHTGIIYRNPSN